MNLNLLISQKNSIKTNKNKHYEKYVQKRVNPLNVFYIIHLMKKILILPVQRLFVDRVLGKPISRFKYISMMHKEMQNM
jgi:hypothetical protein